MLSGEEWFDALAMAGVPAFLFQGNAANVRITARTPAFDAAVAARVNGLDEATLLSHLGALPVGAPADSIAQFWGDAGTWSVVVAPSASNDAADRLALVRLPTAGQLRDDTFYNVVQNLPDIVACHDRNFRHLYVNPALDAVTSPLSAADFVGKDHIELGMPRGLVKHWQQVYSTVFATGKTVEEEFVFATDEGPRHFLFHVVPEFSADGSVRTVISAARDISELKQVQRQLEVLAQTDPLTGLMNRRSFEERTAIELDRLKQAGGTLNVLLLDVNDFKSVNDRYGHQAGDEVLVLIARVLEQEIQGNGFAARLGGDEFCIGLIDAAPGEIDDLCRHIRSRIGDLADAAGQPHGISVSIGVTQASGDDHGVSDVLSRVDAVMYHEKRGARSRVSTTSDDD